VRLDPLMTALRMEVRNRLPFCVLLLSAAAAIAALGSPYILRIVEPHSLVITLLLASQAGLLVRYQRRKWMEIYSRNWLSTLPVPHRHLIRMIAFRSFLWPMFALLGVVAVLRAGNLQVVLAVSAGLIVGSVVGWFIPARPRELVADPSRHAATFTSVSTPAPLRSWVMVQAKAWLRPRTLARSLIPAMLALPMGISGNDAIAILVLWALAIYLAILLRALVHVAPEGAMWLSTTPIPFHRFAWDVARDPLVRQVVWTVGATILLIALGSSPALAVRVAEGWLAVVSVTSALALVHARQSTSMRLELIGSACVLALIERFTQHVAFPCALLFSAWRLRRVTR
jgi:hypothetical protein